MKPEHLFPPVTINGMTLKNRAVMHAMGTGYGNADGKPDAVIPAAGAECR
jgi:2,4-dienoyl-CoA reductase-like NADH-dependent reductase (Old Yellow Enzyme family)